MGCVRFSGCNWESENGPIREERKIQGVLTLNLSRAPTPAKTLGKVDAVHDNMLVNMNVCRSLALTHNILTL